MTNAESICDLFLRSVREHNRPGRMLAWDGDIIAARSSTQIATEVREIALGLQDLQLAPGERVAILSYNRPEWAIADYAILACGAVTVPIYSTLPPDAVEFILRDSGARVLFAQDEVQLRKVEPGRNQLADLRAVVAIRGRADLSWEDLRVRGRARPPGAFEERLGAVKAGDLATLIYTSGTTGVPKGVMLTHANIVSNLHATRDRIPLGPRDVGLSFLPLSHVFERLVDYALFASGATIAYARSIDSLPEELPIFRPTVMAAVPRVFEKFRDRVLRHAADLPPRRRRLFDWALRVGLETLPYRTEGRPLPPVLRLRRAIADRLVLQRIRARTGGRVRFFMSGGAPLSREVNEFFWAVGLPIFEGYGLTETSPVVAVNSPGACCLGTVGRPVPGVEVRIGPDGEILVRGPNVMQGYLGRPEESSEVLRDGWFHTGDIGQFDAGGFLRITDRKKDLFKTSGGKYIAPQPIENMLRESPYIDNAVVVGANRKYAVALLVPNRESLARRIGPGNGGEWLERARAVLDEEIARVNQRLARHETIKRYALLDHDFALERGEITPTMKVRRRVIEEGYAAIIDSLYPPEP